MRLMERLRTLLASLAMSSLIASASGCGGGAADASDSGAALPTCTSTMDSSPAMSPTSFCEIFLSVCGTTHAGLGSMSECVATYAALTTTKPMRQQCQSYHLCTAAGLTGDNRDNHCTHAGADPGNMVCIQDD
jgi:hypothetical protein